MDVERVRMLWWMSGGCLLKSVVHESACLAFEHQIASLLGRARRFGLGFGLGLGLIGQAVQVETLTQPLS